MGIRDELKKIDEEERKRIEEEKRKELEDAQKRREQEEMAREAQKRAEEEAKRLKEESEKKMHEERLINIIANPEPNMDEPHVYLLKGIYNACMKQTVIHQGAYPYIGEGERCTSKVKELRSVRIIMTEREYLLMKELEMLNTLISYESSRLESSNIAEIKEPKGPPYYNYYISKEISDYELEKIDSITDVSQEITPEEQRKVELVRKKVELIRNMDESQKNRRAKMRMKGRDEIEISDKQAALCSINYNQGTFLLSEELEKEAEEMRRAEEARIVEKQKKIEEAKKAEKKGFTFSDIKNALGKVFSRNEK